MPYSAGYEWTNRRGQVFICVPDHPHGRSGPGNQPGFVARARLVMEDHLERYLFPSERVLHVDGDPGNDDIENLMHFDDASSMAAHISENYQKRKAELEPKYGKYAALPAGQRELLLANQEAKAVEAGRAEAAEKEAARLEKLRASAKARSERRRAEKAAERERRARANK